MKQVYFICTGNTCRSPMAEGLFLAALKKNGLSALCAVKSAGLAAFPGSPPSENAVAAARKFGADISLHRSNAMTAYDLSAENYYVCMTASQEEFLRRLVPDGRFLTLAVSDPFGGDAVCYDSCCKEIQTKMPQVFRFVFGFDEIHSMKETDLDGVGEIEKACFAHPWSRQSLAEELDNATARFFVASLDNKPVGYIGANNISGEVFVANVGVLPQHRKKGIAKALLAKLISGCKQEHATFITLEVRESNTPAKALYSAFGFTERGRRKRFYSEPEEDALIYTLDFALEN